MSGIGEITGDSIRSVLLTKRQRNEIFEKVSACGLDPASCELQDPASRAATVASLRHEASGSSFTLRPDHDQAGKHGASRSVGSADFGRCSACDWEQLMESLVAWAQEITYEAETPDLWAELQQVPEIMATAQAADASNAPFTPAEQAEISNRLDEIKQLVREQFELTDEQLAAIDQRLDDAEEASKRLGRKDWLLIFYGGLVSTFMTDAVPPSVIQTVLTTVVHGIAHIFGIGGPPPIIST
jgi:hypothetical protein